MNLLKHIWFLIFLLGFNAESTQIFIKDSFGVNHTVDLTGKEFHDYTVKDLRDNFVKLDSVQMIMTRLKFTRNDVALIALGEKLQDDSFLCYPFKKEINTGKRLESAGACIHALFLPDSYKPESYKLDKKGMINRLEDLLNRVINIQFADNVPTVMIHIIKQLTIDWNEGNEYISEQDFSMLNSIKDIRDYLKITRAGSPLGKRVKEIVMSSFIEPTKTLRIKLGEKIQTLKILNEDDYSLEIMREVNDLIVQFSGKLRLFEVNACFEIFDDQCSLVPLENYIDPALNKVGREINFLEGIRLLN